MSRTLTRLGCVAVLAAGSLLVASPALAHGDDETTEGYLLVQQALGYLADSGPDGLDLALEKVDDALVAPDQEGVDVDELQAGANALEAGDAQRARTLLADSIADALAALPPATGMETGTTQIDSEMSGWTGMGPWQWVFVALSVAVGVAGAVLARRFRPQHDLRSLQTILGDGHGVDSTGTPESKGTRQS